MLYLKPPENCSYKNLHKEVIISDPKNVYYFGFRSDMGGVALENPTNPVHNMYETLIKTPVTMEQKHEASNPKT